MKTFSVIAGRPAVLTWVVLTAATVVSCSLGAHHGLSTGLAACVFIIAGLKAWLIGLDFMELRHADPRLRIGFEVACSVITLVLCGFSVWR